MIFYLVKGIFLGEKIAISGLCDRCNIGGGGLGPCTLVLRSSIEGCLEIDEYFMEC